MERLGGGRKGDPGLPKQQEGARNKKSNVGWSNNTINNNSNRYYREDIRKLESHRALYKEALQHQAEEVRRQIAAISARKDLRKKKPRRSNSEHLIDQPHPSLAKIHAPATNVISKVTSTNGQHQSSTASLHRKVVRKKLPHLSTIAGPKSLNPAQIRLRFTGRH